MVEIRMDEMMQEYVVKKREREIKLLREGEGEEKEMNPRETAFSRGKRKTSQSSDRTWSEYKIKKRTKKSTFSTRRVRETVYSLPTVRSCKSNHNTGDFLLHHQ